MRVNNFIDETETVDDCCWICNTICTVFSDTTNNLVSN